MKCTDLKFTMSLSSAYNYVNTPINIQNIFITTESFFLPVSNPSLPPAKAITVLPEISFAWFSFFGLTLWHVGS